MGKTDMERDVGAQWDWKLEATLGVGDPAKKGGLSWSSFRSHGLPVILSVWVYTLGVLGVLRPLLVGGPSGEIALSQDRPPFLAAQLHLCCSRGTHLMGLYLDLPASEKGCRSRNLGEKLGFAVVFISQSCSPASFSTVLMTLHMAYAPTVLPMPGDPGVEP